MERKKITDFYAHGFESGRLEEELFRLEGIRTKAIIQRYLLPKKLSILDVGGGAGYYSFWLKSMGHEVTLLDLSPENIRLAEEHSAKREISLDKIVTGDATNLQFENDSFDIVLLLGPLYHLIEKKERVTALTEARRVLKPGGVLLAAVISRYASLIDGFLRDLVIDDNFFNLLKSDLKTGIHLNETDKLNYFTTAFFHTPDEIKSEVMESGLHFKKLIAVESFGWAVRGFGEKQKDTRYMEKLFEIIRSVESSQDIVAMSPHIIAVSEKK